jgi:integrase
MTDKTISPLRRRMIEDMRIRGFTPTTQRGYITAVRDFTAFFGRSPDQARAEDLRRYQLHMRSSEASATTMNAAVSALRFFFGVTLRRGDAQVGMTTVRQPRKLPVILSPQEVARLLDAAPGLKYQAALSLAYGAGLRASEVVSLKVSDIDRERMVIRVEQGKGRKDRYAKLSEPLLEWLRAWWLAARERGVMLPGGWLFPGQNPVNPLTTRQLNRAFHGARQAAGIPRVKPEGRLAGDAAHVTALLRHPPVGAEGGHPADPGAVGARSQLDTTARYSHVDSSTLRAVKSPLEQLARKKKPKP